MSSRNGSAVVSGDDRIATTIAGVGLSTGQLSFIANFAPDPKNEEAVQDFAECYKEEFRKTSAGSPDISWEKMRTIITNVQRKQNRMGSNGHDHRELLKKRKKRLKATKPCYVRLPR